MAYAPFAQSDFIDQKIDNISQKVDALTEYIGKMEQAMFGGRIYQTSNNYQPSTMQSYATATRMAVNPFDKIIKPNAEAIYYGIQPKGVVIQDESMDEEGRIYKKYFGGYNQCRRHERTQCPKCLARVEREEEIALGKEEQAQEEHHLSTLPPISVTEVPLDVDGSSAAMCQKAKAVESFEKQIEVIQTVEDLSEEELDKIKVKDVKTRAKKATENMTVGHAKKLLKKPGWLDKLLCKLS